MNLQRRAVGRALAVSVAAAASAGCSSRSSASPSSLASMTAGHKALLFVDSFTLPEVDRSLWNVSVTDGNTPAVNNEQQAYADLKSTVYVSQAISGADGGALVISADESYGHKTPTGRVFPFISARIDTKAHFVFNKGSVMARIKLPAGSGLWPALWLLGPDSLRWPARGEVDVMENVGYSNWVSHALHGSGYGGITPFTHRGGLPASFNSTQWHVYGATIKGDSIAFAIDGQEICRFTRKQVEERGPWPFDSPKYIVLNLAVGGVYPFAINKVRAPFFGVPQSTVTRIAKGKGLMYIDWVAVTEV